MGISDIVRGLIGFAQSQVNRIVSPEARQRVYAQATGFAHDRPMLAAFIAIQVVFAVIPLLLFLLFVVFALLFALGTALLFILFWVGVAVLVLLFALCLTFAIALCVWIWATASFVAGRSVIGGISGLLGPSDTPESTSLPAALQLGSGTSSSSPLQSSNSSSTAPSWAKVGEQDSDSKDSKGSNGTKDGKDSKDSKDTKKDTKEKDEKKQDKEKKDGHTTKTT